MNVLVISGSPRKNGNTESVMAAVTGVLRDKGYSVELVRLNDFPLLGCQACSHCRTKGDQCILEDPISETLEKLKQADRLVIGSPNYMGYVSAQLKTLLDRMYSLKDKNRNTRVKQGKKAVLVFAQGHGDKKAYCDAYAKVAKILGSNNIEVVDTIVACKVEPPGEVRGYPEIMAAAKEAGEKL